MVSVLVLSWNHEKFIEQSLQSIIDQTYKDIEIVFLDNNSADNTFAIAENILKHSGIKYNAFVRSKNYGVAENHNYLLEKSQGEYVCIISGDDWLDKRNIEEKIRAFEADPSLGLVDSGGYKYYDELDVYEPIDVKPMLKEEILTELLQRNFISGVGCIIKRQVFETVGKWDHSLPIEDWDMWIRIALKYNIVKINKPLFYYRQHVNGISKDFEFMYRAKMQTFHKHLHLNKYKEQSKKNIWETFIGGKVMQKISPSVTWQILNKFRLNKFYLKLLVKSLVPVSFKKKYYNRSLKKRNPKKPY